MDSQFLFIGWGMSVAPQDALPAAAFAFLRKTVPYFGESIELLLHNLEGEECVLMVQPLQEGEAMVGVPAWKGGYLRLLMRWMFSKAVSILRADRRNLVYSMLSSRSQMRYIQLTYTPLTITPAFKSHSRCGGAGLMNCRAGAVWQSANNFKMEELCEQIAERFQRVQEVLRGTVGSERFRVLKEEEKVRCEKEGFMLSMLRANRAMQSASKQLYMRVSYEIMRKINPDFRHEMALDRLEDHFLNDFVGLYRHFFFQFEEVFNFKLKLQSLIRPTNHNLIPDLVKYLVDFSRDYYQQAFFWHMKALARPHSHEQLAESHPESPDPEAAEITKQMAIAKKLGRTSLNEIVLQRSISKRSEDEQSLPKKDPFRHYDILELGGMPAIATQPKDLTTNIEVLKIRINELYRETKSRNVAIKALAQSYYSRYYSQKGQSKGKEYLELQDDNLNRATHPYRMALIVEKNGFNYISLTLGENRYQSKQKDKKLSPLKASQRVIPLPEAKPKADYMLTSLRIIRISDNPLTSLGLTHLSPPSNTTVNLPAIENNSRLNLVSSNSAANEQEIERRAKKQSLQGQQQRIAKQKSSRRLNELKRSFKSEEKREPILGGNDPQKKIYDWLEKLRQIKEIERKKIMGLS